VFSGSTVYSPGDNYPGQIRVMTRDFVPSSWNPVPIEAGDSASVAIAAAIALAVIWFLGRGK